MFSQRAIWLSKRTPNCGQSILTKQAKNFVVADNIAGRQRNQIIDKLRQINVDTIERYAQRGAKKSIRAMVVGVPNTGKSTLINCLCKDKTNYRGQPSRRDKRGKQWVSLAEGLSCLTRRAARFRLRLKTSKGVASCFHWLY